MNKSNKILLGVLSFVVVCVVGYALFSENITVTGTATAKGSFDITASCNTGASDSLKAVFDYLPNISFSTVEGGYSNDSCSVNGSAVSFETDLSMPSARRYFTIKLTNTGTITAQFDITSGYSLSYNWCLDEDGDDIAESCSDEMANDLIFIHPAGFIKSDGTQVLLTDSNAQVEFGDPNNDDIVVLSPQESLIVLGVVQWREEDDLDELNGKLFTLNGTAEFYFEQITAN